MPDPSKVKHGYNATYFTGQNHLFTHYLENFLAPLLLLAGLSVNFG